MNRPRWLISIVLLLLVANVAYHVWKSWGLITIHCEDWPVGRVIQEIEKQGHVAVRSNVPAETKVRMHVDRVPVAEAMITLSAVVEARWRLAYVFAHDLPAIENAVGAFVAGNQPEGWKTLHFPLGALGESEEPGLAPDPRRDVWEVKPAEPATAQAYVEQAALSVSAAFFFPAAWNPPVTSAPPVGPITAAAPRLAQAASGRVLEVFLLEKNKRWAEPRPPGEDDGETNPRFAGNRAAMAKRVQAAIDKMPPDKKALAEEQRAFYASLRDLPIEQRRAKYEEYIQRPGVEERMEARLSDQFNRMTPQQRLKQAQKYLENKQAVKSGAR